jgi:hypothetical protein
MTLFCRSGGPPGQVELALFDEPASRSPQRVGERFDVVEALSKLNVLKFGDLARETEAKRQIVMGFFDAAAEAATSARFRAD